MSGQNSSHLQFMRRQIRQQAISQGSDSSQSVPPTTLNPQIASKPKVRLCRPTTNSSAKLRKPAQHIKVKGYRKSGQLKRTNGGQQDLYRQTLVRSLTKNAWRGGPEWEVAKPFGVARLSDIHPRGIPKSLSGWEDMWPTSGKLPGQPGYGYSKDGPPTGADYIAYSRDRLASIANSSSRAPIPTMGGSSQAIEELEQAGWDETIEAVKQVRRSSNRKRLDTAGSKKYAQSREKEELHFVLSFNPEFEL